MGVLQLERAADSSAGPFGTDDQELCEVFVSSLANTVVSASRFFQLERMWHIAGSEEPCRDIPSVMKRLAAMAESVLNVEHCYVYAVNRVTKCIEVYPDPDKEAMKSFPIGQGIVGKVGSSGEMLVLEEPQQNPHFFKEVDQLFAGELRTMGCIPVVVNSQVEGVLYLANKKGEDAPFGITDFPVFKAS